LQLPLPIQSRGSHWEGKDSDIINAIKTKKSGVTCNYHYQPTFIEEARWNNRRQHAAKYTKEEKREEEVHSIKHYRIGDM